MVWEATDGKERKGMGKARHEKGREGKAWGSQDRRGEGRAAGTDPRALWPLVIFWSRGL